MGLLMKLRNYEERGVILFFIIILFISIFVFSCFSYFYKIPNYCLVQGIVFRDNLLEILVLEDDMNLIYDNGFVYVNDKKIKYKINSILSNVLVKDKEKYNLVYIECLLDNEKERDVVDLVFIKNRIRLVEIFKLIFKGD